MGVSRGYVRGLKVDDNSQEWEWGRERLVLGMVPEWKLLTVHVGS